MSECEITSRCDSRVRSMSGGAEREVRRKLSCFCLSTTYPLPRVGLTRRSMSRLLHAATLNLRRGALWEVQPSEAIVPHQQCPELKTVVLSYGHCCRYVSIVAGPRASPKQVSCLMAV
jgi:hypothetical protein